MLDWVHRKVLLEPECIEALPAVLAAWVQVALHRRGLATEHITPVVDAVATFADQFRDLSTDGSIGGPAKEIVTRMLAEGVDLDDREAVEHVISAYDAEQNARRLLKL
jgi:hypothetical protein